MSEKKYYRIERFPHAHISSKFENLGKDDSAREYRLGIFGGTFDPVHSAHIAVAEAAVEELGLDALLFIPANEQPFKRNERHASAENRYRMLYKTVFENPKFDVSCIEIDRKGVSYSYETLQELREFFPSNVKFYFIVGTDILNSLYHWRKPEVIADLATLAIASRPGYEYDIFNRMIETGVGYFNFITFNAPELDISSSDIRARLDAKESIDDLCPAQAIQFINVTHLYDDFPYMPNDSIKKERLQSVIDGVRMHLAGKRLGHSFGVAKCCVELARKHGLDEFEAALAGWLHDWDKYLVNDEILALGDKLGIVWRPEAYEAPWVLHAETAAVSTKLEYPWLPSSVLVAIARHTTGGINPEPLDKVLYVADYIEPLRESDEARMRIRNMVETASLDEIFDATKAEICAWIESRGHTPCPGEPFALKSPALELYAPKENREL